MTLKTYHWIQLPQRPSMPPSPPNQETSKCQSPKSPEASAPRRRGPTTRRAALAALALPLAAESAADTDAIAGVIAIAAEKNAAFMRGDMQHWLQVVRIAADFTLMQPLGGPASHGFDASPERLAEMSRYFRNGKTQLEVAKTYSSGDLIVLVMIERQTGEVGGLPEQDWSLRVTEVYRKNGTTWELLHRHADALVHQITLEQLSNLARGTPAPISSGGDRDYVDGGSLATAAPILQDELSFNATQLGVLLSAFFWAYAPAHPLPKPDSG